MSSTNVIQSFSGKHAFLSNFYEAPMKWHVNGLTEKPGLVFKTNEAAFQACKYKAMVDVDIPVERMNYMVSVLQAKTPGEAKALGRKVKIDVAKWDAVKVDVMRKVVFEKFRQHADLRKALVDTGHALLVEGNTWGDKFWGRCEGKGYNILGGILMEIRGYWLWTLNTEDIRTPVNTDPLAYPHGA